jgi:5,10-methylene-tetrahydrofolate dehydrogenase/methenyl tetrahydrofolate cyclohydrolase
MLQGIELIDCAKANAKQGVGVAAALSGYEKNVDLFIENLQKACQQIGVKISELEDLITDQQVAKENRQVIEISPDTVDEL